MSLLLAGQPEPWQYLVAHGLKVVVGAVAGVVLAQRQSAGKSAGRENNHARSSV
jgi:hypothetical protein